MKIWFDTEFYEDGDTIELISIGMVREDGKTYYAETRKAIKLANKTDWLKENVLPHLWGVYDNRSQIREQIIKFAGENPEFWAYYGAYDWVVLCQLFGTMMELPKNWPMFCMDVKQLAVMKGDPELPQQKSAEHNALADAIWTKEAWEFLQDG